MLPYCLLLQTMLNVLELWIHVPHMQSSTILFFTSIHIFKKVRKKVPPSLLVLHVYYWSNRLEEKVT